MQLQTTKLLSFARNITTIIPPQCTAIAPSSSALMEEYGGKTRVSDIYSSNRRIDGLMKSGCLNSAIHLFEEMPDRDVISWNLLISGHSRNGFPEEALVLFKQMVSQGIRETPSTCSSVLGICTDSGFYQEGLQVQCRIISLGFNSNLFVGSALVDLYIHMGLPGLALLLFDEMPEQNLPTWNLVLRGFCDLGRSKELLGFYSEMNLDDLEGNSLTFCYLIRGCGIGGLMDEGKQLHCRVIKIGFTESELFVTNALVDFYSACGNWIDASKAIEVIPLQDVISWNSIVAVYADNGFLTEALEFFARMHSWGKKPSIRSFVGFLNLASRMRNLRFGEQIHGYVLKLGFDCGAIHVRSALIDMYGKCGEIERSVFLFEDVSEKSTEFCNSLMTSLLHCGIIDDVIEMFGLMVDEGVEPDQVTYSTTLKALSASASVIRTSCKLLHCSIIKSGFESDMVISCSLMDAYSRSGHIDVSYQIFERIPAPNVICFTSIITGFARYGRGREGITMLDKMIKKNLNPDAITLLSILTGCSHSGLVEEGRMVFESMRIVHGIYPDRRHYSCMVDLFGRAGLLEEAEELLKLTAFVGDSVMWSSLLGSCRVHRNEEVGKRAAKALMELEPEDPAAYLQASNFYSEIGDSETSTLIREIKVARKIRREIGYSLVEVNKHGYS